MARRITEEQIEEINRRYYECGVKAQVAREMGISASSVAKYIQKGWRPASVIANEIEEILERKDITPTGMGDFVLYVSAADNPVTAFCEFCKLSNEEWADMAAIQQELVMTV